MPNPQVAAGGNPAATANPTPFNVKVPGDGVYITDPIGGGILIKQGNTLYQTGVQSLGQQYAKTLGNTRGGSANGVTYANAADMANGNGPFAQQLGKEYLNSIGVDYNSLASMGGAQVADVLGNAGKLGLNFAATPNLDSISSYFKTPATAGTSATLNGPGTGAAPNAHDIALGTMAQSLQLAFTQGKNVQTTTDANGNITSSTATPLGQPQVSGIGNTVTPPTGTGGTGPTLPNPQGAGAAAQYTTGVAATLQAQQQQLQDAYKQQQTNYQTKIDALTTQNKELQTLQDNGMAGDLAITQQETAQKQAALAQEKQQFEENYNANQSLINEMDGLLTQGNQIVQQMQDTTGLSSIMQPRIAKTMSDVAARTGVIQAVLAARNGQIGQAQNQLTSSLNAITSIAKDQIDYYKAIVDFYGQQKTDNNAKIKDLSADQKTYIDAQIGLLKDNLTQTQNTANIISKAMLDPTTAMAYAKAGISLNDSVQQIQQKLATYEQAQALQWSPPVKLGGDYIQTNKVTGETRTVVSNVTTGTGGTPALSNAAVNNGAANAGLAITDFKALPVDVQNYYNQLSTANAAAINKLISDANNGKQDIASVQQQIRDSNTSPAVKEYLQTLITSQPKSHNPLSAVESFFGNLWNTVQGK